MKMLNKTIRLGVNIDHIATLRNARDDGYIDLTRVAKALKKSRVHSITVHLREDRRHIKDEDVKLLKKINILPINLEMAPTNEMMNFCKKVKPFACCIVPEKREEKTTEGGLDLEKNYEIIKKIILNLKKINTRTSLFIEPCEKQIRIANQLQVDAVELHTGKYAKLYEKKKYMKELKQIENAANFCYKLGMECHAGHGLNLKNVRQILSIKYISELNIGYFIVAESVFQGLEKVIGNFKNLMNKRIK
tara:strand:- start:104 stop:847 length:744 start_codon:yes stop_codon:yes gene_type:complete